MRDDRLARDVWLLLQGAPEGMTAAELLQFLVVDKRSVNRVLYRRPDLFERSEDMPPRWRVVVGSASEVESSVAQGELGPPRSGGASPIAGARAGAQTVDSGPALPVGRAASLIPSGQAARPAALAAHVRVPGGAIVAQLPELRAWQKEALATWRARGHCGVIEAVTGTGKTMVGLAAVAEELERRGKALVLVPTQELQRQWLAQLERGFHHARISALGGGNQPPVDPLRDHDVVVAIVNSARDRELRPPSGKGLLVADECHRYGSEANAGALKQPFARRLGLSATYQRNDDGVADWLDPYFGGTCFSLGYDRAVPEGIVARFSVALVGARFGAAELAEYHALTSEVGRLKARLVNRFGAPEEPFSEFMRAVEAMRRGGSRREGVAANRFLKAFSDRRKLLAETRVKFDALRALAPAIGSAERTLVFTQTIEGALRAAEVLDEAGIASGTVHSQMPATDRRDRLGAFAEGRLRALVAPQVLDEGIDVPEADMAIIMASSRTRRQMIQRMGRVLRRKRDNRLARFAILFIEDTSEDPRQGAHEGFLDDLTGVAEAIALFPSDAGRQASHYLRATTHAQLEAVLPCGLGTAGNFARRPLGDVPLRQTPRCI